MKDSVNRFVSLVVLPVYLVLFVGAGFLNADEYDEVATGELYEEGLGLFNGRGGERNFDLAAKRFRIAAMAGHGPSQHVLAVFYANGLGVRKSQKQAVKWWGLAADQSYPLAMFELGKAFLEGRGCEKDRARAKELFETIVDPKARFDMSTMDFGVLRAVKGSTAYLLGLMLVEDFERTQEEFLLNRGLGLMEQSSSLGNADAVLFLAMNYAKGEHAEVDVHRAMELFDQYKLILSDSMRRRYELSMEGLESAVVEDIEKELPEVESGLNSYVDRMIVSFVSDQLREPSDTRSLSDRDAIDLLKIASAGGLYIAQFELALLLLRADPELRNESLAYEYMSKAASKDTSLASYNKGVMLFLGLGVDQDIQGAEKLFRRANSSGLYVARLQLDGDGDLGVMDESEALQLCLDAVERKDARAMYSYTYRERMGRGVTREDNAKKLFRKFLETAKMGNTGAQFEVGEAYYYGHGVSQNMKKALHWLEAAREGGNRDAVFRLAYMNSSGIGVPRDDGKAFDLYSLVADESVGAMNNLANLYANGQVVTKDYAKACDLYQMAALEGYVVAMENLAMCHEQGTGVFKNLDMAIVWYERAAEKGSRKAALALVSIYGDSRADLGEESYWHEVAAEGGEMKSMLVMAKRYRNGTGVRKSNLKSFQWAASFLSSRASAKSVSFWDFIAGDYEAQKYIALALSETNWTGSNPGEAAKLWRKLANDGNEEAQFELANMHVKKAFPGARPEKGINAYRRLYGSQKSGMPKSFAGQAAFALAHCYRNGNGVESDVAQSMMWLKRSIELGKIEAYFELAMMHFEEEIDSPSKNEGRKLMYQAARKGHEPALFWFAQWHLENELESPEAQRSIDWLKIQARNGNAKARQLLREFSVPYEELKKREGELPEQEKDGVITDLDIALLIDSEFSVNCAA